MSSNKDITEKEIERLLKNQAAQDVPEKVLQDFEQSVMSKIDTLPNAHPRIGFGMMLTATCVILLLSLGLTGLYLRIAATRPTPPSEINTPAAQSSQAIRQLSLVEQLTLIEEVDVDAKQFLIDLMGQESYLLTEFQIVQQISSINNSRSF